MAKSLLFPNATDLSDKDLAALEEAYELACDELVGELGYSSEQLSDAIEPMALRYLLFIGLANTTKPSSGDTRRFRQSKPRQSMKIKGVTLVPSDRHFAVFVSNGD